ncbi:MAG: Stk1 family PASTA domain-containing Ser/Thr kinase [Butyrivibrio sp.]|nr:Stk1 family PASTA domain-containing Ser/Thr kinase [Acetatifactor muris]MCM1558467.1 Stk1 family PASTA domain-containing Ser/Thr kinase [Butyrivibrio sp.]
MVKIGMMIGDRYEILEKIGTGGMSDVYKAKCHKLNRFVAVKVLKQEFSENANFVSKFRVEAQAAAGLMHPNIVNVYDVGEENGIYYIVMELVEGITLKKYIEKKARLSYKEAVSIAIQVGMGIEAAHNNHIIHRDIKPQNIIISKDGKVKVTDFGIAKAATSNTITSNVMGSVHYTSPEQARGGYSDEKSDIYSLGITLFEMLTGRVPFNGETTVAIAIKHIQEELPSPKDFVPEIPGVVESIVLKCCQKSPDRRYQSAQELIADLKQSLMNPDEDFVVQNDVEMDGDTRMITENEVAQIKRRTVYQEEYPEREESMRLRSDTEAMYENEAEPEDGEEYDYNPRMERVTTFLAVFAGIVICIILIVLVVNIINGIGSEPGESGQGSGLIQTGEEDTEESSGESESQETAYVPMPSVRGKTVEEARNALKELGLESDVNYEESDSLEAGTVIGAEFQGSPVQEGADIPVGSTVILTASAGPRGEVVPSVVGRTYETAYNMLLDGGFTVSRLDAYSDTVEAGIVAMQSPGADSKVAKGSEIVLTVSLGPESLKTKVPQLLGLTEMDGIVVATEAKLQIGTVSREYNAAYAEGLICYQSYSKDLEVAQGTVIQITVSLGPEPTPEPSPTLYKWNASIAAPTLEEAPDYTSGSTVHLKLVADDGLVLLDTSPSSFPYATNYYNLTSSGGTLTVTYTVTVREEGPDENGEVGAGTTEEKSFTRRIEFTPQ